MNRQFHEGHRLSLTICLLSSLLISACGGGAGSEPASSGTAAVTSATNDPAVNPAGNAGDTTAAVATGGTASAMALTATSRTTTSTAAPSTQDTRTTKIVASTATEVKGATKVLTTDATSSASEISSSNAAAWPFAQPALATLRASPKKVFAHYLPPFPISIDNLDQSIDYYSGYMSPAGESGKFSASGGFIKQRPMPRLPIAAATWDLVDSSQDVRRASAAGIDGFAVDLLSTSGVPWTAAQRLLDAASAIDPGFKILLMPDMEGEFKTQPNNVLTAIRTLARHPAAYRLDDGRLVVSPYNAQNQSVAWWTQTFATLRAEGIAVAFVPVFQNWSKYAADYAPISYAMSDWGDRSPTVNRAWAATAAKAQAYGTKWMMPVSPQDSRAKDLLYWEAGNSLNYRVMWEGAISGGSDWVQIITWNDYSEATEISPSSGTQWSFYDLTAYYTAWFKTGIQPTITRDVLYYFHRIQATTAAPDLSRQARVYQVGGGSDTPANEVELLAFTTSAATLSITSGGQTYKREVSAGMNSFKVPLAQGTPTFTLLRGGSPVMTLPSGFAVSNTITYQDLLYRSGSSARPLVSPK